MKTTNKTLTQKVANILETGVLPTGTICIPLAQLLDEDLVTEMNDGETRWIINRFKQAADRGGK